MKTTTQVIDKADFDALKEATNGMVPLSEEELKFLRKVLLDKLLDAECPAHTARNLAENVRISIMTPPDRAERWPKVDSIALSESFADSLVRISHVLAAKGCPEDQLEQAILDAVTITVVQGQRAENISRLLTQEGPTSIN